MSEGRHARIAIGCGGTGGHLFPGLAVAQELRRRNCHVTLLVSPKEVDQTAIHGVDDALEFVTLPAVGLAGGNLAQFISGFARSYRRARKYFQSNAPQAVLAMGGFTSAPPVLAARQQGARCYLHESNTIPGRSNRWLSWIVNRAFVGFPEAASHLHTRQVTVTGTPVRAQFSARESGACRWALGLDPERPVVLVMGGSQGASGINRLVQQSLPTIKAAAPEFQWLHLSGSTDCESVKNAYLQYGLRAAVFPFFREMELALGAASVAVSRAGASSLAELAAMRVPAVLVPYPAATDDHQTSNALAFEESGAARLLVQEQADPQKLTGLLLELARDTAVRAVVQRALGRWHRPQAADEIADQICRDLESSSLHAQSTGIPKGSAAPPSGNSGLRQEVAA